MFLVGFGLEQYIALTNIASFPNLFFVLEHAASPTEISTGCMYILLQNIASWEI